MPLTSTCNCGAISLTLPHTPRWINDCQCNICHRYGAAWAYYSTTEVQIESKAGTSTKLWKREGGHAEIHFCETCGCMMYWWPRDGGDPKDPEGFGVNTKNVPREALAKVERRMMFDMND